MGKGMGKGKKKKSAGGGIEGMDGVKGKVGGGGGNERVFQLENAKLDAKDNCMYKGRDAEAVSKKVWKNHKWMEKIVLIDQSTGERHQFNCKDFSFNAVKKPHKAKGNERERRRDLNWD